MKLLCVIPAHNEEQNIASVAGGAKLLGYDVLVIDDGSIDQTVAAAKGVNAEVVSTGKKSGKGSALRFGFTCAIKNGYDAVMALDADGQHLPLDIASFIKCLEMTGADIVNGNRMGNPKGMPWIRWVTNTFMSFVISGMCRQRIPDSQCGFRLVTTRVLKNITLASTDFEIETELLIKASKKGYKIAAVPIASIYRNEVSKIRPLRDTVRFIKYIFKEMFS